MMRLLGLAAIALQLSCTNAIAICGPGLVNTIFHARIPENITAMSVLEVTILRTFDGSGINAFVGVAKVSKVIKGPPIKGDRITISAPYDDCFIRALPGEHGMVVGSLQINEKGDSELSALLERAWKIRQRR